MTGTDGMRGTETSPESAALHTHLARFCRRVSFLLFAKSFCIAGSVALVVAAGVVAGLHAFSAGPSIVVAIAAALVTAAAATAALRPSNRATAAVIDRRLHLQDRIVTAVQCQSGGDAFSRLVVQDAVERLSAISPSEAFPFQMPLARRGAVLTSAALTVSVVIVATMAPGWRGAKTNPGTPMSGDGPASPARSAKSAVAPGSTSVAEAPTASPRTRVGPSSEAVLPPRSISPPAGAEQRPLGGDAATQPGTGTGDHASAAFANPGTRNGVARIAESNNGTAVQGAATSAAAGPSTHVGGVNGSPAMTDRVARAAPPPVADAAYVAAYRAGRASAEAAIAQERIPVDRRAYVRQYFVAIRPGGQR
jgi:hypothetical protein